MCYRDYNISMECVHICMVCIFGKERAHMDRLTHEISTYLYVMIVYVFTIILVTVRLSTLGMHITDSF